MSPIKQWLLPNRLKILLLNKIKIVIFSHNLGNKKILIFYDYYYLKITLRFLTATRLKNKYIQYYNIVKFIKKNSNQTLKQWNMLPNG